MSPISPQETWNWEKSTELPPPTSRHLVSLRLGLGGTPEGQTGGRLYLQSRSEEGSHSQMPTGKVGNKNE